MTNITGVSWDEGWASRQAGTYGGVPLFFLGRETLVANKTAAGRPKDLADVDALKSRELINIKLGKESGPAR